MARHDPLAALRQRDFRYFVASRTFSAAAQTLQQATIAWQVYQLSGSALQLGVLGLVRFVPSLGVSLIGGAVADSYDRRRIVFAAQVAPLTCSAALLGATIHGSTSLPFIYALVLIIGIASAFESPARQALLPQIVPRTLFPNAVTVNQTFQQLAFVLGPALGGVMIAERGIAGAYTVHVGLVGVAMLALLPLRPRREPGERRAASVAAIKEGISFVRHRQVLVGAMTLDMFGVIFGGATALLPVYAEKILKVGGAGYGVLTSSDGVGALIMSILLVALPPIRRTGRVLLVGVGAFGLLTIAFGLSRSFPLSLLAYGLIGAADQVSVIMRQTTIQLATPDELRGRVSSVSGLFIGASNQIGAVESGFVAALTSATIAVVSGGVACVAVVGAIAAGMPELRRYRITPMALRRIAPEPHEAEALAEGSE